MISSKRGGNDELEQNPGGERSQRGWLCRGWVTRGEGLVLAQPRRAFCEMLLAGGAEPSWDPPNLQRK